MLTASVQPLPQLDGAREDIISFLGPILGKAKVEAFMNSLEERVRSEAKKGAEAAIPTIKTEVRSTVKPYVIGALAAGGVGAVLGLFAILRTRKR